VAGSLRMVCLLLKEYRNTEEEGEVPVSRLCMGSCIRTMMKKCIEERGKSFSPFLSPKRQNSSPLCLSYWRRKSLCTLARRKAFLPLPCAVEVNLSK
jgi:hypothetical protein